MYLVVVYILEKNVGDVCSHVAVRPISETRPSLTVSIKNLEVVDVGLVVINEVPARSVPVASTFQLRRSEN